MLPDRSRQLLTSYVDGELTARQRRHVARLLRRSEEARQLLQQLQEDAQTLRQLPQPRLVLDLSPSVLQTIAERRLTPSQARLARISTTASWSGLLSSLAAAAAVLIVLGMAAYYCFIASIAPSTTHELAATNKTPSQDSPQHDRLENSVALEKNQNSQTTDEVKVPIHPQATDDKSPVIARKTDEKKNLPNIDSTSIPPEQESPLTDRVERFHLDRVVNNLPVVHKLSDLDLETGRKNFMDELTRDRCFRLELPCTHGTKAFERVERAAHNLNLELILEKQAQERIKAKWRTSYLVYLESLSPEELTRFIRQIGSEDRNHPSSKKETQFDALVLSPITTQQRKEWTTLLGFDFPNPESAASSPLGSDNRTPLSDQTAEQVAKSLAGKGGVPRPDVGKSATKPTVHHGLVLPLNTTQLSAGSEEVKRFLETRKTARPGSICVVLVLRS